MVRNLRYFFTFISITINTIIAIIIIFFILVWIGSPTDVHLTTCGPPGKKFGPPALDFRLDLGVSGFQLVVAI